MKTVFLWFYGIGVIIAMFGAYDICHKMWTNQPLGVAAQITITFAIILLCLNVVEYFLNDLTKWLKTRV